MLRRLTQLTVVNAKRNIHCSASVTSSIQTTAGNATTENSSQPKWDLYAGVLVERMPVVSKSLNEIEKQFQELLLRIEYENSLKSDYELQHERDIAQRELIKKGQAEVDLDDGAVKQSAQDLKDAYKEELKRFQMAPRTTPEDAKNNKTSIDRCLEDSLYLLIQEKLGNQTHFLLPQGQRLDGETMRQTAERVLREKCGEHIEVDFYGNAPCGFYKYKYPANMRDKSVGAKVFFYRATLRQGNMDTSSGRKFEWLPKEGLSEKLKNESYAENVKKFLI